MSGIEFGEELVYRPSSLGIAATAITRAIESLALYPAGLSSFTASLHRRPMSRTTRVYQLV